MRSQKAGEGRQIVHCRVGGESFAVDLGQVEGFRRAARLEWPTPSDPARMDGVSIWPLAELLDRPGGGGRAASHVVLMKGGWGLLTDGVSGVVPLARGAIRPLPPLLGRWPRIPASNVVLGDGAPSLLLDAARLMPDAGVGPLPAVDADEGADDAPAASGGKLLLVPLTQPGPGERPLCCGLALAGVREIVELPPLSPVPRGPSFLLGLASWRSRAVPVIDLAARLGLPPLERDRRSRLLVLRAGEAGLVGMLVGQAARVVGLPLEHVPCRRPLPVDARGVRGAVETARETVVVPDLEWALGAH